jgi:hypothetical protein
MNWSKNMLRKAVFNTVRTGGNVLIPQGYPRGLNDAPYKAKNEEQCGYITSKRVKLIN